MFRPETLEQKAEHYRQLRTAARIALGSHPGLIERAEQEIVAIRKRIDDLHRQLANAPALLAQAENKLSELETKIVEREATQGTRPAKSTLQRMLDRRDNLRAKLRELNASIDKQARE